MDNYYRIDSATSKTTQIETDRDGERKSLGMAIGLNLFIPGAGYFYLGDAYRGILALIIVPLILWFSPLFYALWVWIGLMALLAMDMLIIHEKHANTEQATDMKLCPYCAEPIKKAAVLCKHCGSKLEA